MFFSKETFSLLGVAIVFTVAVSGAAADNAWRTVEVFRRTQTDLETFRSHPAKDAAADEINRLAQWLEEGTAHLAARRIKEAEAMAERLVLQVVCVRAALEKGVLAARIQEKTEAIVRAKQLLEEKKQQLLRLKTSAQKPQETAP